MTLLCGLFAALVIVGPTALIASAFGWSRCGAPPWRSTFWTS